MSKELKIINANKVLKLSVSSMKTYEMCPRKYYYTYLDKPDIPPKDWSFLILGNFVHDTLELFHNKLMDNKEQDFRKLMSLTCKEIEKRKDYAGKVPQETNKDIKIILMAYLHELDEKGLTNVIENERSFNIDLGNNVIVRGKIDRIDLGYEGHPGTHHVIDYKGLYLDTPIPTPDGWSTMEELKVGDHIFGSHGHPVEVIGKSKVQHNRPCYKLEFSNGFEVICDNVHLWPVECTGLYRNKREKIMSAEELYNEFTSPIRKGDFAIKNAEPITLPEINLPIDPWILGAWLGDRHSETGSLTIEEQDLADMLELIKELWGDVKVTKKRERKESHKDVFTVTLTKPDAEQCGYGHNLNDSIIYKGARHCKGCRSTSEHHKFDKGERFNVPLRTILSKEGLRLNKHIPQFYLRSSVKQREELLRGLMDTDGHWDREEETCVFVSANFNLVEQVLELVRSLGLSSYICKSVDEDNRLSWQMKFCPMNFNPFRMKRKANAFVEDSKGFTEAKKVSNSRNRIKGISKVDSVPTQCIEVDSKDSIYLCGKGLICSHNTGKSKYLDDFQILVYGIDLMRNNPDLMEYRGSYLALKENMKWISYNFTRADVEKTVRKVLEYAKSLREDCTWTTKPQFLCNWCDFEVVCNDAPRNKYKDVTKKVAGGEVDW